jgi:hypothetical protein
VDLVDGVVILCRRVIINMARDAYVNTTPARLSGYLALHIKASITPSERIVFGVQANVLAGTSRCSSGPPCIARMTYGRRRRSKRMASK